MDASLRCCLCTLPLTAWRDDSLVLREAVENGMGTGRLIRREWVPFFNPFGEDRHDLSVHSGCWSIATVALNREHFQQRWIDQFAVVLRNLSPFLTPIRFAAPTGELDPDITVLTQAVKDDTEQGGNFPIPLLPDIIQIVYTFLDHEDDVVSLATVTGCDPPLRRWREFGRKYRLDRSENSAERPDYRSNVENIVRRLWRNRPDRFPKTTNYRTVWDNVQLVVQAMENPLVLAEVPMDATVPHGRVLNSVPSGTSTRFAVSAKELSRLTFIFDIRGLTGVILNGVLVGRRGPYWSSVSVNNIKGLHIATFDGHFVGIQVRDGSTWQPRWHGRLPRDGDFYRLEWESSLTELVVSFNVSERSCISGTSSGLRVFGG